MTPLSPLRSSFATLPRASALALAVAAMAGVAAPAQAQLGAPRLTAPNSGPSQMRVVVSNVLSVLQKSKVVGTVDPKQTIHISIGLKPRDLAGLKAFCDSVSDPTSLSYQQYLTPADAGIRFGASAADQAAVVSYLKSQGLQVTLVAASRMAILAQGTAAQIQTAFGTTLKQYQGPSADGKSQITFRANATPLSLPVSVAGPVQSIGGVSDYVRPTPASNTTLLTPNLSRGLYGSAIPFKAGFHGEGQTLGISNWDGYRITNAQAFIQRFGLPYPSTGPASNVVDMPVGTAAGPGNPAGECDLDIQMMLSTAPMAKILVYDSTGDLLSVLTQEQEDNMASIISESWGWGFGDDTAYADSCHNEHLLMTAQGITYMAASGDWGTQWPVSLPYPDADPDVLAVGGSTATVDASTGARVNEVVWNDGGGQGGGGYNTEPYSFNTLPKYQKGRGVPTNVKYRLVPDVALHAGGGSSNYAYSIFYNGALNQFDGTSASSPTFAANLAVVEQRIAQINPKKARLGRIQDLIYAQNGRADVWYDITSGSVGKLPDGSNAVAGIGWDYASGWGAPNFDAFYRLMGVNLTPYNILPSNAWIYPKPNPATDYTTQVSSADMDTADIPSTYTAGLGWTAGMETVFNLQPGSGNSVYELAVDYAGLAQSGATLQFFGYNWAKKQYVLLASKPAAASVSVDFGTGSAIAPYVSATNQVDLMVRALLPVRPGNGSFVFSVDKVNVVAHYIVNY